MNTISRLKLPIKIMMSVLIATAIAAATIAVPATAHAGPIRQRRAGIPTNRRHPSSRSRVALSLPFEPHPWIIE
jgi:hypothetical protein